MAPADAAEWEECWSCRNRNGSHKVRQYKGHGPASESIERDNRRPGKDDNREWMEE